MRPNLWKKDDGRVFKNIFQELQYIEDKTKTKKTCKHEQNLKKKPNNSYNKSSVSTKG